MESELDYIFFIVIGTVVLILILLIIFLFILGIINDFIIHKNSQYGKNKTHTNRKTRRK